MLFPTFEFFVFFTVVIILNWFLKRWPLIWRLFLLLTSYYFYSVLDIRFVGILLLVSFFNFFTGQVIYKNLLGNKKFALVLAIFGNLLCLGLFKYYDFFRISAETLLYKIGLPFTLPLMEVILVLGLSFYILRAISYNADIYLGKIPATSSFLDFSIYISFFPQLLSGPIARAGDFLLQLKDGGAKKIENFPENIALILLGLFKKLVISSSLVLSITDDVFAVPENHSFLIVLLTVFAYSLVIYFDFSGYSDMAIGFAGLMGFKSPINFNTPYLATNLQDFWRRWHVSLANWIRDYVYIPLGGNRKGNIRKYLNLMMAMIMVGLWHNLTTNFVIWGGIHGLGLVITHFYQDTKAKKILNIASRLNLSPVRNLKNILTKFFWWFMTFNFVSFAWIFFRAENTEHALAFIKNLFVFEKILEPFKIYIIILMFVGFLLFLFEKQIIQGLVVVQQSAPLMIYFLFVIITLILIFKFSPDNLPSFIYFNF